MRGKMGVESFYVKIKNTKISDIKALMEEYGDCLDFSVDNDYFCITGALVSFFPAVELIYNICNAIIDRLLYIGSLNREVCFNFDSYFDFLDWMYKLGEKSSITLIKITAYLQLNRQNTINRIANYRKNIIEKFKFFNRACEHR